MEQTFMTIHNLTPECNILFASESVSDILGWRAEELHGRSVFDYFHPDEVPFARSIHSRGILLDKAASLHYVRILSRDARWVSCECCFTVVHDVLVACTSIYRRGEKSERRAIEGAQIRRIFSSSPRDPRYHMLEHLSPKFKIPPMEREPRAALILNRFTRNLTIMFATNAVASVLGLSPEQVKDKSFYRCIQERCLPDALKCLESAKANDSIAYLRFWSRDPREEEDFANEDHGQEDEPMANEDVGSSASDSEGGGAALETRMDVDTDEGGSRQIKREEDLDTMRFLPSASGSSGQSSSGHVASTSSYQNPYETPLTQHSPADGTRPGPRWRRQPLLSLELEAVVSCTSDGLVVILRRARPPIPPAHPPLVLPPWEFENGLFAAPWAQQPVRPYFPPEMLYTFRPPLLPQFMPLRESVKAAGGPPLDQLMRSIRDVAVFAWALCGINGNLAVYSHGQPMGEAAPPEGLPFWDPTSVTSMYQPPENQAAARWAAIDNSQDRGEAPAMQQPLSPTSYYAPPYQMSSSTRQDPQYGMENYVHGTSDPAYPVQQSSYNAAGQTPTAQHQYKPPLPSPSYHGYAAEPWRSEPQLRSSVNVSSVPFAVPTTQASSRSDSPQEFGHGWP